MDRWRFAIAVSIQLLQRSASPGLASRRSREEFKSLLQSLKLGRLELGTHCQIQCVALTNRHGHVGLKISILANEAVCGPASP